MKLKKIFTAFIGVTMALSVAMVRPAAAATKYELERAKYYNWDHDSFYQLNETQQALYNKIYDDILFENIDDEQQKIILDYTVNTDEGITKEQLWQTEFAILEDYPELYWLSKVRVNGTVTPLKEKNKYNCHVELFTVGTKAEINEMDEKISAIREQVKEKTKDMKSNYEKVKYIHDYICSLADYDFNALNARTEKNNWYAWSSAGVFTKGKAVCAGFSTAFWTLCYDARVPCNIMNNPSHQWNTVLMEDGKWYSVDCNFDDESYYYGSKEGHVIYKYFLAGMDTVGSSYNITKNYNNTMSSKTNYGITKTYDYTISDKGYPVKK